MNKRLLSLAVAGGLVLGLAGVASAGIPDAVQSSASTDGGVVLITPAGTGGSIADARNIDGSGTSVNATVTVTILDAGGLPVPNFPFQDVYLGKDLDDLASTVSLCQGGSAADANTNALGITTIGGVISGGGHGLTSQVYINSSPLAQAPLNLALNSPDINGDLSVDLGDFSAFGIAFGSSDFEADLVFDGTVDLGDFSRFGQSYFQQCP
jgi:hypothetical protein